MQHFILHLFIQAGIVPSICLSHTVVLFRNTEKVHVASNFSPLSGWSYQAPLAWECDHRISQCRKTIFTLLKTSAINRSFMSQKQPQYCCIKCFVYFNVCGQCVLLLFLFDQQQAWVQLAFAEVCYLWGHRGICISNYRMEWVGEIFPIAFFSSDIK